MPPEITIVVDSSGLALCVCQNKTTIRVNMNADQAAQVASILLAKARAAQMCDKSVYISQA
jgi:hypothetical protein